MHTISKARRLSNETTYVLRILSVRVLFARLLQIRLQLLDHSVERRVAREPLLPQRLCPLLLAHLLPPFSDAEQVRQIVLLLQELADTTQINAMNTGTHMSAYLLLARLGRDLLQLPPLLLLALCDPRQLLLRLLLCRR